MKTWKPTTAGILILIAGIVNLIVGLIAVTVGELSSLSYGFMGGGIIGAPILILGIFSIVGGILSLKRRVWGLGLFGAICALFPAVIFGILRIIFVSMGKNEFE